MFQICLALVVEETFWITNDMLPSWSSFHFAKPTSTDKSPTFGDWGDGWHDIVDQSQGDLERRKVGDLLATGQDQRLTKGWVSMGKAWVLVRKWSPNFCWNLKLLHLVFWMSKEPSEFFRKKIATQVSFLGLLNLGDGSCIASKGTLATQGQWLWELKDWIDRRWMWNYAEGDWPRKSSSKIRALSWLWVGFEYRHPKYLEVGTAVHLWPSGVKQPISVLVGYKLDP